MSIACGGLLSALPGETMKGSRVFPQLFTPFKDFKRKKSITNKAQPFYSMLRENIIKEKIRQCCDWNVCIEILW